MLILILGLILFLGVHSTRIVADDWRSARIASIGERRWKLLYTVGVLAGLTLIVWGYSLARQAPVILWAPPAGSRHLTALLVLISFPLLAAAKVPRNHFKSLLHHPMYAGTILWSGGHLISNGTVADLLLFGGFLVWSLAGFTAARARDHRQDISYPAGTLRGTLIVLAAGTVLWLLFAFYLHGLLFGVRPLG